MGSLQGTLSNCYEEESLIMQMIQLARGPSRGHLQASGHQKGHKRQLEDAMNPQNGCSQFMEIVLDFLREEMGA